MVISSPQGELSAPARAEHHTATASKYPPPDLEDREKQLLEDKIGRVACSEPWRRQLYDQVMAGEVKYKEQDQAKELRRVGLYPPGGVGTRMKRCDCCGRWAPRARAMRERTVTKLKDGQVKVELTPWVPLCIDCYYSGLPLLVMVSLPSSPGFSTPIPDDDASAMFDGSGNGRRRRYLGGRGAVHEEAEGEDGFVYDLVVIPAPADTAAAPAAAEKGG